MRARKTRVGAARAIASSASSPSPHDDDAFAFAGRRVDDVRVSSAIWKGGAPRRARPTGLGPGVQESRAERSPTTPSSTTTALSRRVGGAAWEPARARARARASSPSAPSAACDTRRVEDVGGVGVSDIEQIASEGDHPLPAQAVVCAHSGLGGGGAASEPQSTCMTPGSRRGPSSVRARRRRRRRRRRGRPWCEATMPPKTHGANPASYISGGGRASLAASLRRRRHRRGRRRVASSSDDASSGALSSTSRGETRRSAQVGAGDAHKRDVARGGHFNSSASAPEMREGLDLGAVEPEEQERAGGGWSVAGVGGSSAVRFGGGPTNGSSPKS